MGRMSLVIIGENVLLHHCARSIREKQVNSVSVRSWLGDFPEHWQGRGDVE